MPNFTRTSFVGGVRPVTPPPPRTSACTPSTRAVDGGRHGTGHAVYQKLLTWAFTLFSSLRVVAYLPTLAAIWATGDTSQHSLWTWGAWLGSNLTMAAWLIEQQGGRLTRAAAVCLANGSMCAATTASIVVLRLVG